MKYGSVCSGVEAASLAWMPLGWEPVFFSEVEPFPCAVLQQRFGATRPIRPLDPDEAKDDKDRKLRTLWLKSIKNLPNTGVMPNLGDFTKIKESDYEGTIDLLVGGTPCQDLSTAGKREGFNGKRSHLAIDFVRLAYQLGCRWVVWENVLGVFSSNSGADFATLLSLFTGCKVGIPKQGFATSGFVCPSRRDRFAVAWRVLDAQFTRVSGFPYAIPQRRRRVFLVGYFGDWRRPAEVLLEPKRMSWAYPQRIKVRERFAKDSERYFETTSTIRMRAGRRGGGKGALVSENISNSLKTLNDQALVTFDDVYCVSFDRGFGCPVTKEVSQTLMAGFYRGCIQKSTVRRFLPVEYERLMGFPDDFTLISWNGKPEKKCPDSPRFKACGNSMCVNCMRWIGEQIDRVEKQYSTLTERCFQNDLRH